MTKLSYMVGNEEIATYAEAKKKAAETGLPMTPTYTLMVMEQKTDPARMEKIQRFFAKKRKLKRA